MSDVQNKDIKHVQYGKYQALIVELEKEIEEKEKEKRELNSAICNMEVEGSHKKQSLHRYEKQSRAGKQRIQYVLKTAAKLDKLIASNFKKLGVSQQAFNSTVIALSNTDKEIAESIQKCNDAMDLIKTLRDNDDMLTNEVKDLEHQLTVQVSKYKSLEAQCSKMGEEEEDAKQELEEYKKQFATSESLVKNMQIKIKYLDTQLQQKMEECVAMSAMYDEIQNNTS